MSSVVGDTSGKVDDVTALKTEDGGDQVEDVATPTTTSPTATASGASKEEKKLKVTFEKENTGQNENETVSEFVEKPSEETEILTNVDDKTESSLTTNADTPTTTATSSDNESAKEQPQEEEEEDEDKVTLKDVLKLLKYSFDGYDYNLNGNVAHEEVMEAWMMCMEEWKMPMDEKRCELEASIFMKDIDKGGDGEVDFDEYVKYFQHLWKISTGLIVEE